MSLMYLQVGQHYHFDGVPLSLTGKVTDAGVEVEVHPGNVDAIRALLLKSGGPLGKVEAQAGESRRDEVAEIHSKVDALSRQIQLDQKATNAALDQLLKKSTAIESAKELAGAGKK